jgi:hypothetical protein
MLLAALICVLSVRLLLSMIWSRSHLERLVGWVADPVIAFFGLFTPRIVPFRLLILAAITWLMAARIALFLGLRILGLGPTSLS